MTPGQFSQSYGGDSTLILLCRVDVGTPMASLVNPFPASLEGPQPLPCVADTRQPPAPSALCKGTPRTGHFLLQL